MNDQMSGLVQALIEGDHEKSLLETLALREANVSVTDIVKQGIQPAMEALDNKCTVDQFNLLEIMLTGRAVSVVAKTLFPHSEDPPDPKATVVVTTLEGDVHDIGKYIVKMILLGNRFRVVDCGKDVPLEKIINTVKNENAFALCVSGLITSVIPTMRQVRAELNKAGLDKVKLLAGGAALKQSSAESLQVDFVGQTAFDAAAYLEQLLGDES